MKKLFAMNKVFTLICAAIILAAAVSCFLPGLKAVAPYVDTQILTLGCSTLSQTDEAAITAAVKAKTDAEFKLEPAEFISDEKAAAVLTFTDPSVDEATVNNIVNNLNLSSDEYSIISFVTAPAMNFKMMAVTSGAVLLLIAIALFVYVLLRNLSRAGVYAGLFAVLTVITAAALPLAICNFTGMGFTAATVGAMLAGSVFGGAFFALSASRFAKDRAGNVDADAAAQTTLAATAKADLFTAIFTLIICGALIAAGIVSNTAALTTAAVLLLCSLLAAIAAVRFAAIPRWAECLTAVEAAAPDKRRARKEKAAAKAKAEKEKARQQASKNGAKAAKKK